MKRTFFGPIRQTLWKMAILVPLVLVACAPAAAPAPTPTPTQTPPAPSYTIKTSSKAGFGNYLVDGNGRTLYYFAKDTLGVSNASGAVLQAWPIFYTQNVTIPSNLDAGDFTVITRSDGNKQSAYYGWPLYYYSGDQVPGDTKGDGLNGVWFLDKVDFYTVLSMNKADVGNYLADVNGKTLYWTSRDIAGQSNITGTTLVNWPVFLSTADAKPALVIPSSLNAADFGTITRADGNKQTTYKGWPLYYFIQDKASGDTTGQGVAGVWFTVNPTASGPTPSPTVTITAPPNGSSVIQGNVTVNAQVANFNVADKQGQANAPGEGHLHFYLDVDAPVTPGQPAIPPGGVWAHVSGTTYTFNNVAPGSHTISVQLVNNDHTPVIPPVVAKITITVLSAGGGGSSY